MQGHVSENALRHALTLSGEMDRWDAVTLGAKDRERLDDALNAVTDLVYTVPPSRPIPELTWANGLLRQLADCLRSARTSTTVRCGLSRATVRQCGPASLPPSRPSSAGAEIRFQRAESPPNQASVCCMNLHSQSTHNPSR